MKFFIAILTIVAFATAEHSEEDKQKWLNFKLEHGKLFLSKSKEVDRMNTFLKNAKKVEEHNEAFQNGEVHYDTHIHKHSDLSEETFLSRFGGVNMPAEARNIDSNKLVTLRQTPPASLDLRTHFKSWPVRDQLGCGSCWTFSTCASIEYAYMKYKGIEGDTSEQQLVDCVYGLAGGCSGGWMPVAMNYISRHGGLAWEHQYAYTATSGTCKADSLPKAVRLSSDYAGQMASDDVSIKNALNEHGVLSICVDADKWGFYKSGIFTSANYANPSCTHAVALVGYGADAVTGIPYWIVRNSWGTSWFGEGGYIRLDARRDPTTLKPMGGIMLNYAFYPILE